MRLLPFALFLLLAACGGGTKLSTPVLQDNVMQAQNCDEAYHLLQVDAGAQLAATLAQARSDIHVCICSARFTLAQAGNALGDAGREGCPQ